ncbi:MAG: hypothetical protein MZU97_15080 [Bacillus subtilis]|nr:hypothetical protein [Bacillus subtilis]
MTASLRESEEQYKLLTTQMPLGLALHEVIVNEEGKPVGLSVLEREQQF